MRLIPRLASDTATSFSLILKKPSVVEHSCLGTPTDDCEDFGSEHQNETAHPTVSMADNEYARANRSDYFANLLVGQIDLIALKDLFSQNQI